jgi:hypothetical protein
MKPLRTITAFCLVAVWRTQLFAGQVVEVPSQGASTIALGMIKAKASDTVLVADGVYTGQILAKPDVGLKSRTPWGAVLDGGGKDAVVSLSGNAEVNGFIIRNGTIGITSSRSGNAVVKCRITANLQSGIMCVGDVPRIEDNVIAFNKGSGIQGWNLNSTTSAVNHNTIAYNGNNGIALGGNSNVVLEYNIIAFNQQAGIKARGHVKTSITANDFYKNGAIPDVVADKNYSVDPMFAAPRDKLDFSLLPGSPLKAILANNEEIGARSF